MTTAPPEPAPDPDVVPSGDPTGVPTPEPMPGQPAEPLPDTSRVGTASSG